jgi:hypothetical protein
MASARTRRLLAELGYRADVSVRAFDYRSEGGPDFSAMRPFRTGWKRLVEIPLTAAIRRAASATGRRHVRSRRRSAAARPARPLG